MINAIDPVLFHCLMATQPRKPQSLREVFRSSGRAGRKRARI